MSRNILITGAAGYIVGSIVANLLSKHPETTKQQVFAAVRTDEQAKALSTLGINVLKVDLSDEQTVVNEISSHKISVIVHAANSINPELALPLINALAKQKESAGKPTHFIHTSGLSAFYANSGWPRTVNKDTYAVFETEKEFADSYPIRKTDVMVIEYAQAQGVTPFVIVPSIVYGRGTGAWNQLSVMVPGLTQASLKLGRVYKFDENISLQAVHISGLTALYCRIIHAALKNEEIPSRKEGYYSAVSHETDMWEFQDHLAAAMKARGLVSSNKPEKYPSDEFAADAVNVPVEFLGALYKSGGNFTAIRPQSIG
ncbi:NAD(P)-binding domain [Fusarium oxysporum f. sp. vasinfectum]|nr:NAD(P)-binding domain [Fusarium oxysporum f. sp. vasinfectum]